MSPTSDPSSSNTSIGRAAFFDIQHNVRNYWYPLIPSSEVSSSQPAKHHIWGDPVVIYRDPSTHEVIAFEDRCPHRAAPLSSGRIMNGNLECRYHGWQYDSAGECVVVPSTAANAKLPNVEIRKYPIREANEWVWIWPGEAEKVDDGGQPGVRLMGGREDEFSAWSGYVDLDIDHSLLVENFLDPAHLPFTHDTTISKRSNATQMTITEVRFTTDSVRCRPVTADRPDLTIVDFEFRVPCGIMLGFTRVPKKVSTAGVPTKPRRPFDQTFYAVPTRKGHCRFIYFQRMPFIPDPSSSLLFRFLPPLKWFFAWWLHRFNKRVLQEDYDMLRGLQQNLAYGARAVDTRVAAPADTIIIVYREWWRKTVGVGKGVWFGGYGTGDIEDIVLETAAICGLAHRKRE
ncbi:uncharacterized protein EV422DRAFT_563238 [Fimicolochytrium jonesii]|uniref:uncharacterized protein n=1 Tax=Fimicolochytrium jonesii TaxID=1396493 RepID=UPI0022FDFBE3|nr:uncharacterized protein EV422DRAFT_563238 [Fimicolochytrium jonesii]KAI8827158.1 hypothetical protein EV422DRAFT_563238 [Fimicolochytrium jonesii]